MFNKLEELNQVAIAANNLYTGQQLVNIGIQLIQNFNDFDRVLTSWYELPPVNHTLINFKLHVEREYQALKQVQGMPTRITAFVQQENTLSSIMETMKQE